MGGGSKGQSQQNTNTYQTQTYAPDQRTISALQAALGKAGDAASNPFSLPVAPVAGFSQDQQNAFNTVNNSQGIGNPYLQQASNYYSPNGAQSFFNPAVDAVTAQMKNIFGQQDVQNTGNLTQAAGGVGADRIAVGQGNLANQQGLAAGQTYAGLWDNAVKSAQGAGQGALATGNQAFNQAFGGAQQQLGTGGLQQQLQQAQMNAPYQWDVARAAFPYQQSNFLTNATAALAPGFGGTTSGYGTSAGTSTPAQPSMFSQLLGAGVAGAGLYGGFNSGSGSGSGSSPMYGNFGQNSPYSPQNAASGGVIRGYDDGGTASPYGATSASPINIAGQSIIPQAQTQRIAPHIPQIDLSPPKQSSSGSSSSSPSMGDIASTALKVGMMFANRGGSVSPENMRTFDGHDPGAFFADGGASLRDMTYRGRTLLEKDREDSSRFKARIDAGMLPQSTSYRDTVDFLRKPVEGYADAGVVDDEPYRMADPAAMNAWRKGVDNDSDAGTSANDLPEIIKTGGARAPKATHALGFTATPDDAAPDVAAPAAPNPYYTTPTAPAPIPTREKGFSDSPWSALMQAGLGMMSGTSPFAGVNIGQGGMQGMKALQQQRENAQKDETIDQAARRLSMEAAHHADSLRQADRPYQQMTAAQKAANDRAEFENGKPVKLGTDKNGYDIMGVRDPDNPRRYLDPFTGEPINPDILRPGSGSGSSPPMSGTPGEPGSTPASGGDGAKILKASLPDGIFLANAEQQKVPFNYSEDGPYIEKGMQVPEPEAIGAHSVASIKQNAENYLQTGKLPPVRAGKSPVAIAQQNYRNAVENYGNALAASRGLTPQEVSEGWRAAPGMMRFVLGQPGNQTVSLGTAVRHLDTLKAYINAFNANDVPALRQIQAMISREFGESAATNIDAVASIVGPEIVKAIGVAGAGTEGDRNNAIALFKGGSGQARSAIEATERLMGGQLEGKENQARAAGVSHERFKSLVGDHAYDVLRDLDKKPIGGTPAKTDSGQPATTDAGKQAKALIRMRELTEGGKTPAEAAATVKSEGLW